MSCCICKCKGSCLGCKCFQSGRSCGNCLPGRLGNCKNRQPTPKSAANPSDGDLSPANPSTLPTSPTRRRFGTETQESESSVSRAGEGEIDSEGSKHGNMEESVPIQPPNFVWATYLVVVQWRRNLFLVPFGKVEKSFIQEMANLFQAYGENSSLDCIALKACLLMQVLLLQKPLKTSKAKDNVTCLQRRLESWKKGEIEVLVAEGQCIQSHLPTTELE